jgi:hypothetical protein
MKIKGPPDYSGPPAPSEFEGGEKQNVSKVQSEKSVTETRLSAEKLSPARADALEKSLREVAETAKKEGLEKEATIGRVVDTVLEQVMGKEFMCGPEAASLRNAIAPLVSSDEYLMGKISNLLSRLGNKSS